MRAPITLTDIGHGVSASCGVVAGEAHAYLHIGPLTTWMTAEAARRLATELIAAAEDADRHDRVKRRAA